MRKLMTLAAATIVIWGTTGPAFAGEVTGQYNRTGAVHNSNSICSYSGLEDGITIIDFDDNGDPIFGPTEFGHGNTQTPHEDGGTLHFPGIPGDACHGGTNPERTR